MVAIIINPVSGGAAPSEGPRRAMLAAAVMTAEGVTGDVSLTERPRHARELAAAAVGRGAERVIAWGGDGTVNEVASALAGTTVALGVVPSGSGNGLARELRIPRGAHRALATAISSATRIIDVGELGGRMFVSIAGIGFDAHVARQFDRAGVARRGFRTYVRITAQELWRYQCGDYRVDGVPAPGALLVTFANSAQFGNGARIAPEARLDDGLLDMVIFEERSRAATLRALPRLFTGSAGKVRGVSIRPIREARVESDVPMIFHVDGEPVEGGTCLDVRVHPASLHVAAPRGGG